MHSLLSLIILLGLSVARSSHQECDAGSQDCGTDGNGLSSYIVESHNLWLKHFHDVNSSDAQHSDCTVNSSSCCHSGAINSDLGVWVGRGGIRRVEFDTAKEKMYGGVHYQIIGHKLYRSTNCLFGPRCRGVEHFILEVIQDLPDMEMIINVHDYPKSSKHRNPLPIFSFSKTPDYYDIMYPAWSFWSGGPSIETEPRGLGRWDEKRKSITESASKWPWNDKAPIAFFRGSRTSEKRDPLVLFSREHPELVDAQYTKNQAWKSEKDTLGYPPAEIVSLEEHCKYKYLFNFRGVAASFRFRHLFLCGSLVLHVGEEWVEFFYDRLKPWVHYLPVKQDLSDLRDVLLFVREYDEVAHQIASRGYDLVWNHLRMEDVKCYWKELLTRYAELITWQVEKEIDTEPIFRL